MFKCWCIANVNKRWSTAFRSLTTDVFFKVWNVQRVVWKWKKRGEWLKVSISRTNRNLNGHIHLNECIIKRCFRIFIEQSGSIRCIHNIRWFLLSPKDTSFKPIYIFCKNQKCTRLFSSTIAATYKLTDPYLLKACKYL